MQIDCIFYEQEYKSVIGIRNLYDKFLFDSLHKDKHLFVSTHLTMPYELPLAQGPTLLA